MISFIPRVGKVKTGQSSGGFTAIIPLIFETFRMTQLLMNKSRIPLHVISLNLFIISFSIKLINSDVIYNHILIH